LRAGEVLVSTAFSVVSTGTETHIIRSTTDAESTVEDQYPGPKPYGPKLRDRRVRWSAPVPRDQQPGYASLGYSLAGTVAAVAPDVLDLAPGNRVACAGSQCAVHAERVAVPRSLVARVPPEVSLERAAFVTLGSIAMHALRRAGCQFGETVVVYGLGTLGLLAVQIARASGMYVFGLDLSAERLRLAERLGAHWVANPATQDVVTSVLDVTDGFGADAVVMAVATESSEPLNIAFDLCRQRASVVGLGAFGMQIERERMFAPDVSLFPALAYGPGRYDPVYEEGNIDHAIGYVRWTENRNMAAFLRLLSEDKLDVDALAPARVPLEAAPAAYDGLLETSNRAPTLVLTY
jgi:threonine dehydrogenase-like Zn-dependent dehydrogenase